MIKRTSILALLALGAALAGCGRQGHLDRPAPLFGKTQQPDAQRLTREQAANRARDEGLLGADPQAPQSFDEVRNQPLPTQRENPIPGSVSDPDPSRKGSLMPDPVASPSAPPQ